MDLLGDRVRALRSDKGLSQSDLARSASISNEYVGKIERSEVKNIGIEVVKSIAKSLDVHPSFLLFGEIITPKITINKKNDIGPLSQKEKSLIIHFRRTSSETERKIIEDVAKQFSKKG